MAHRGCPQGSCLGPLLWTLVADRILKCYKEKERFIIFYADDSEILEGADASKMSEHRINGCVVSFREIGNNIRLNLTASKSMAMLFGRKTMENRRSIFKWMSNSNSVKETITYLAFTVDSRLKWMAHLYNIRIKIQDCTVNVRKTGCKDRDLVNDFLKIN